MNQNEMNCSKDRSQTGLSSLPWNKVGARGGQTIEYIDRCKFAPSQRIQVSASVFDDYRSEHYFISVCSKTLQLQHRLDRGEQLILANQKRRSFLHRQPSFCIDAIPE